MTTGREDRLITMVAVGIALAFAIAGALFAATAAARWFFAGTAVVLVLWPVVRHSRLRRRGRDAFQ
ncbi:hypothetical protein [Janibacter hoylei]|uniref:hypothetical protein n=1 Tax=Janibacter hoylei TaxID=364298 RepID=UPI002490EFCD|nr:hypothetical protein [Janibacter hoylei]